LDSTYEKIVEAIYDCKGKLIITGVGKPGHIATKLVATFSSLGTPSFYLHPGEAMHGDLGMISNEDLVLAMSFSGESDEIIQILPNIKLIGAPIIAITANSESTLAKAADLVQVLPQFDEACYLGLAPTSSTTVELCYGDSLAVVLSEIYGFDAVDFGKFHPAGALGKKLILKVKDLMTTGDKIPIINFDSSMKDAILELSKKGVGAVIVLDSDNSFLGLITDGDLRRQLEKEVDIYSLKVEQIMTSHPITITENKLAVEALNLMKDNDIACLPVIEGDKAVGIIRIQDIIRAGIVS
jgi:arabinose-5-phosphate isomerase